MSFFPHELSTANTQELPAIEWEEPDCLLCGKREATTLVEAVDHQTQGVGCWFAVVQCQSCGLCYTNPRPSERSIGQFYPSSYRPHRTPDPKRPTKRTSWWRSTRPPKRERFKPTWQGQGRLLDFGCGGGRFLASMHEQAWQVTGVDVSAGAISRVRRELGLRAYVGSLPHPDLEPLSFDVITMWHSLEHVHEPIAVLREARRLLVPGGKLLVAVPNIDSLPFRWFGPYWYGLDLPRHITHFAPWTLHLMLEKAGFRVGPVRLVRHSDWLRSSAKRLCASGEASMWHFWLQRKFFSRLATWQNYMLGQCDCMMVTAER